MFESSLRVTRISSCFVSPLADQPHDAFMIPKSSSTFPCRMSLFLVASKFRIIHGVWYCFFCLTSHSRIFHSCRDVSSEGPQTLISALAAVCVRVLYSINKKVVMCLLYINTYTIWIPSSDHLTNVYAPCRLRGHWENDIIRDGMNTKTWRGDGKDQGKSYLDKPNM